MGNYTIQRTSVIIVGLVLVLGILALLSQYQPQQVNPLIVQNKISVTPNPPFNNTIPPPKPNITNYKVTYSFLTALKGINASSSYTFNSTTLFDFGYNYSPLASDIAEILSLPANKVTPKTYGELYNVLDANYTIWNSTRTVFLYYYPMSLNGSTTYINFTFYTEPQFVSKYNVLNNNYPFPPSDNVTVGSVTYKIINKTSVTTSVKLSLSYSYYLLYNYTISFGNTVYDYEYYIMYLQGSAFLYANGKLIDVMPVWYTFFWYGGSYYDTIDGFITVPPGVLKEVYGSYTITSNPGFYEYQEQVGNMTYVYCIYYPQTPQLSTTGYNFNWYEYNISIPLRITVYNGSNPITYINNKTYDTRTINTTLYYTTWSSYPQSSSWSIKTIDHLLYLNYNISRTWYAGTVEVTPNSYTEQNGNIINCYLNFNVNKNITQPPPYIFQPIPQLNKTAVLEWSYFFNNYTVAESLYNLTHHNIDQFNYVLPQFISALYKENQTIPTLTLASFIEPWNVSNVTLNIAGLLKNTQMFFLPVNITPNTTYWGIYSALGKVNGLNVTLLDYTWNNYTVGGYFPPLTENSLYNGTIPPSTYSPFSNKILMNYGYYWAYGLPYAKFNVVQAPEVYNYWYNPTLQEWGQVS